MLHFSGLQANRMGVLEIKETVDKTTTSNVFKKFLAFVFYPLLLLCLLRFMFLVVWLLFITRSSNAILRIIMNICYGSLFFIHYNYFVGIFFLLRLICSLGSFYYICWWCCYRMLIWKKKKKRKLLLNSPKIQEKMVFVLPLSKIILFES